MYVPHLATWNNGMLLSSAALDFVVFIAH